MPGRSKSPAPRARKRTAKPVDTAATKGPSKAKLRSVFTSIDTDNSGTLDLEELTMAIAKAGIALNEDAIEQLFEQGDVDGDGLIDFDEFVTITETSVSWKALVPSLTNQVRATLDAGTELLQPLHKMALQSSAPSGANELQAPSGMMRILAYPVAMLFGLMISGIIGFVTVQANTTANFFGATFINHERAALQFNILNICITWGINLLVALNGYASIGHYFFGMIVTDAEGNKLSFGQIFGLILVKALFCLLIFIDVVLVLQGGETCAMRVFGYRLALKSSFDKPHGPWPRR